MNLDQLRKELFGDSQSSYSGTSSTTDDVSLSSEEVDSLADEASKTYNVPKEVIRGIIDVENPKYLPKAKNPKSSATGMMQITKATADAIGLKNPEDPRENIMFGTKLYKQLLDKYGDRDTATAAYFQGETVVDQHLKSGKSVADMQQTDATGYKTSSYLDKVNQNIQKYSSGDTAPMQPIQSGKKPMVSAEPTDASPKNMNMDDVRRMFEEEMKAPIPERIPQQTTQQSSTPDTQQMQPVGSPQPQYGGNMATTVPPPEKRPGVFEDLGNAATAGLAKATESFYSVPAGIASTFLMGSNALNKMINVVAGKPVLNDNVKIPSWLIDNKLVQIPKVVGDEAGKKVSTGKTEGENIITLAAKGKIGEAARYMGNWIAQQAPNQAMNMAMFMSGVPKMEVLGYIGLATVGDKEVENKPKVDSGELSQLQSSTSAVLGGVAEAGFEAFGDAKVAEGLKKVFVDKVKEVGFEKAKETTFKTFKKIAAGFFEAAGQEIPSEVATEIAQGLTDKYSGVDPNMTADQLWGRIGDVATGTLLMGGAPGMLTGLGKSMNVKDQQKQYQQEQEQRKLEAVGQKLEADPNFQKWANQPDLTGTVEPTVDRKSYIDKLKAEHKNDEIQMPDEYYDDLANKIQSMQQQPEVPKPEGLEEQIMEPVRKQADLQPTIENDLSPTIQEEVNGAELHTVGRNTTATETAKKENSKEAEKVSPEVSKSIPEENGKNPGRGTGTEPVVKNQPTDSKLIEIPATEEQLSLGQSLAENNGKVVFQRSNNGLSATNPTTGKKTDLKVSFEFRDKETGNNVTLTGIDELNSETLEQKIIQSRKNHAEGEEFRKKEGLRPTSELDEEDRISKQKRAKAEEFKEKDTAPTKDLIVKAFDNSNTKYDYNNLDLEDYNTTKKTYDDYKANLSQREEALSKMPISKEQNSEKIDIKRTKHAINKWEKEVKPWMENGLKEKGIEIPSAEPKTNPNPTEPQNKTTEIPSTDIVDKMAAALHNNLVKSRTSKGETISPEESDRMLQSSKNQAAALKDNIDRKNINALENRLTVLGNKGSRKAFEIATGLPLPNTVKGTQEVIRKFVGEEAYDNNKKSFEDAQKKRESDDRQRIFEEKQNKELGVKVKHNNKVQTYKEIIDNKIADGWSVKMEQQGIRKIYKLVKDDLYFPLPTKAVGEYAVKARNENPIDNGIVDNTNVVDDELTSMNKDLAAKIKEANQERQIKKRIELSQEIKVLQEKIKNYTSPDIAPKQEVQVEEVEYENLPVNVTGTRLNIGDVVRIGAKGSKSAIYGTVTKKDLNGKHGFEIKNNKGEHETIPSLDRVYKSKQTGATENNLESTNNIKENTDEKEVSQKTETVLKSEGETPSFSAKTAKEIAHEKFIKKQAERNKKDAVPSATKEIVIPEDARSQKTKVDEVVTKEQELAADAMKRAGDALRKLGESFGKRDPNTLYSIGTEQAELAFEAVSALVEAGYHNFKAMSLQIAELAKDYVKIPGFRNAIEDAYDSYQEDDANIEERKESFEDIINKGVNDDSKGTGKLLETVATEDVKGAGDGKTNEAGNQDTEGAGRDDQEVSGQGTGTTRSAGDSRPANDNPEARRRRGVDHVINPQDIANKKARSASSTDDTLKAVKLVKELEKENRLATPEEQKVLQGFSGWGVLSSALNENIDNMPWNTRRVAEWLRANLSPEEMETARRSRATSHYTSVDVVQGIWNAVKGFGFTGGNVLEPAIGASGNFIGLRPTDIDMNIDGVEMDLISAKIAGQLYQNAEVQGTPYEKYDIRKNYYDLVISNVPFYDVVPSDKNYKKYGLEKNDMFLHNFYFAKSIHATRPGGIVAFVTTHGTLDAKSKRSHIDYITEHGNILGAVRLPNTAFADIAGTEVVTDIIFVQKKRHGEESNENNKLFNELQTIELTKEVKDGKAPIKKSVPINKYFAVHPEMVVGEHSLAGSMYGPDEYTVDAPENYTEALSRALSNLPKDVINYDADFRNNTRDRMGGTPKESPLGSYYEQDGKIYQKRLNYETDEFYGDPVKVDAKTLERIKSILKLKNAARELFIKQVSTDDDVKTDIKKLEKQYDGFVTKHGYLHDKENVRIIENDPDMAMVLALERINKQTQKYEKADFLKKEIQRRPSEVGKVDNIKDAYILSLVDRGRLDLDYISKKTDKTKEEVTKNLLEEKMIFENPATYLEYGEESGKEYVAREQYLSGNVRKKYKQAKKAAEKDSRFTINVDELRDIQPMERTQEQIYLNPENPAVNEKYISDFIKEVILNDQSDRSLSVEHDRVGANFTINYGAYNTLNVEGGVVTSRGKRIPQTEVFEYAINNQKPGLTYTEDGVKYPDTDAINKISEMGNQLKEKFREWVWTDEKRANDIIDAYNDMYNNKHNRKYVHPARVVDPEAVVRFVGSSYIPRKHQADVVWRIIQSQTCMMAHEVGAGKTFACIAAAMELKRLGLRKKNMILVPNNMTGNWEKEIRAAYPGANILVSSDTNFSVLKRKEFINNAAMNNYDIIVMRYSHYLAIAPSETMASQYIGKRIETLQRMLSEVDQSDKRAATRKEKDIQKQVDRLQNRLNKIIDDIKKDVGIPTFDQMGVDQLFVDEADNFKNLNYQSKIQNILGMGNREGSNQAIDLHIKTQHILNKNGGVVFATGTPISNSLVETYHMTNYLQPWYLEDSGLEAFDEWTNAMAEGKTSFEQNASGTGIVKRTRLTKYTNVQTLVAELSEVWDVVDARYLEEQGILVKGKHLPKVKRTIIEIPASDMLQDYMMHLMEREDEIRARKGPPKKGDDIIPVVMLHGAIAAIDLQIINKNIPKKGYSKLDAVVDAAIERRKKFPDKAGVIFYDKTAPKKGKDAVGIDPYQVIKDRLIASGTTKAEEIAIIHDFKKDELVEKVFDRINRGEIKVLLGNTERMGAGVNIQENLKWLFHVDTRHRPRDILQREGRIIRQGNNNDEIEIVTFVTKGTADAGMWELINTKAKMIGNILNGRDKNTHVFDEEDQFDNVSVAALLSPSLKERAQINQDIKAITDKRSYLVSKKRTAEKEVKSVKAMVARTENAIIPAYQNDYNSIPENKEDIVVEFSDKKIKGVKEARTELLKRFKEFEDTSINSEKIQLAKVGNIVITIELKTIEERNIDGTHSLANLINATLKREKSNKVYLESYYTAEGLYNKISSIKNVIGKLIEDEKQTLAQNKRLVDKYNVDINIDTESMDAKLKELKATLSETEKKVEAETAERSAAYKQRTSAPNYESYDWYRFEAERKTTVSEDEDADSEEPGNIPAKQTKGLSGAITKDGDTFELAEPDNVYRNLSDGFSLIEKPYKVDIGIKGEFFAYKDGKGWRVVEGTTGQLIGNTLSKTKIEAINAALKIIDQVGENTLEVALKKSLTGISPQSHGLSPRYTVVQKKVSSASVPAPYKPFSLAQVTAGATPVPVTMNPVQAVQNAPTGKKMQYAQARMRIQKNISNEEGKGSGTEFLTKLEKIKTDWFEDVFPFLKLEDIHDTELGITREGARQLDIAVDGVNGAPGATHQYMKENLDPILKQIDKGRGIKNITDRIRGEVYTELNTYLVAKRAVWQYENNPKFEDLGISKDDASSVVEMIETGAHPYSDLILKIAPQLWAYNKGLLQIKQKAGVLDGQAILNLDEPYYVPFYRDSKTDHQTGVTAGGKRFYNISTGIKKGVTGSKSGKKIIDPIQSMQLQTFETIINAKRTELENTLIKLAKESKEVQKYFKKLPARWIKAGTLEYRAEVDTLLRPVLDEIASDLGITKEDKVKLAARINGRLKKVLGIYENDTIKTMMGSTEATYAHELGHGIHEKTKWYQDFVNKYESEMNAVGETRFEDESDTKYSEYCLNKEEKAAEFIALYVTDREKLVSLMPKEVKIFETHLLNDDILKKLVGAHPSNIKGIMTKKVDNFVMIHTIPRDADVISSIVDGDIENYQVPIEVAEAIKNMNPAALPEFMRLIFTPVNTVLRAGAVAFNIDYAVTNPVRDTQESAFKGRAIPIYDTFRGLMDLVSKDQKWLSDYERRGGGMDHAETGARGYYKNKDAMKYGGAKYLDKMFWNEYGILRGIGKGSLDAIKLPFVGVQHYLTGPLEKASQIGNYRRLVRGLPKYLEWYSGKKMSPEQAVHIARNVNDFNRGGKISKKLNAIFPFTSTALRGMYTTYAALRHDPKRAILTAFVMGLVPTIGFILANKDEEWYKGIPLREKLNNWIVPNVLRWIGIEAGPKYIKLMKPFWMLPIINPIQIALEKKLGTLDKGWMESYSQVIDDVDPYGVTSPLMYAVNRMTGGTENKPPLRILPLPFKMVMDPIMNYDFYWHQQIENRTMQKTDDPGLRCNEHTSRLLKTIGEASHVSPAMMEHEFVLATGGVGRSLLWLADIAMGDKDAKGTGIDKIPVVRRFWGEINEYRTDQNEEIGNINEELKKLNSLSNSDLNKLPREQGDKIYISNNKRKDLLYARLETLTKAQDAITKMLRNEE